MVVKAAKNHYYHFSLNCSQIIRKRRKKHKILCFFRRFYLFGKDEVAGSNPAISSKKTTRFGGFFFILSLNMGFQGNAHRYNCIQSGTIANFLSMNCEVELFLDCLSVRNALKRPNSALFA